MSNISVDYDVLNQRGSPAWFSDTFANIPTAGFKGRMFISTDTFAFYRDTGTGWDLIGGPGIGTLTGSGVAGQVSFFSGTQVLAGNNNLFWDNVNSRLGIGTITPGQALDIHSTGNVLVQLNNTSTGNSNISFQNQDVAKWRVGNLYNAGANSFDILNATTSTTALSISNTTNAATFNNSVTASSLIKSGGTSSQFLKADGSIDSNSYITLTSLSFVAGSGAYSNTTGVITIPTNNNQITNGAGYITSSALSSYLPLAGGTLTGQLYINPTNAAITGLDVASNTTSFRSDNVEGFKRQLLITMGSGTLIQLAARGFGANYITDIGFYTSTASGTNGSPGIYITGTNNRVGIKTGTPAYDLDVSGTFAVSSTSYFAGNVGIGTANPTRQLFVNSTAFFDNNGDGTTTSPSIAIGSTSVGLSYISGGQLVFLTGALERMRIGSNGNIGIGITNSNVTKLLIKGIDTTGDNYAFVATNSSDANLFYIRNDGFILTGLAASSPYNNSTSGRSAVIEVNGGLGYLVSTRESKGNIQSIKNIDFINQLNPVLFNYRKKDNNMNFTDELYDNINYGFIADEVEKVNKELVFYNKDNTLAGVEYNSIIAILTKAIQEINQKLVKNNIN